VIIVNIMYISFERFELYLQDIENLSLYPIYNLPQKPMNYKNTLYFINKKNQKTHNDLKFK
jgi:hypothetical protein